MFCFFSSLKTGQQFACVQRDAHGGLHAWVGIYLADSGRATCIIDRVSHYQRSLTELIDEFLAFEPPREEIDANCIGNFPETESEE